MDNLMDSAIIFALALCSFFGCTAIYISGQDKNGRDGLISSVLTIAVCFFAGFVTGGGVR
jgi:hypothetical protein